MDEVFDLLKSWELDELISKFTEHGVTIQALSILSNEDIKDIIPQAGPRALFMRCWKVWKSEFSSANLSLSNLDFSNSDLNIELTDLANIPDSNLIIVPPSEICELAREEDVPSTNKENIVPNILAHQPLFKPPTTSNPSAKTKSDVLENLLKDSLETVTLLTNKGGALEGDHSRNLLASAIAKEILKETKNSPIRGHTYFMWTNYIKDLFPGERTTAYYIPACTTANGIILQARGKIVSQVLNKRRRLQQLGALTKGKKRSREESPSTRSQPSPRPLPDILSKSCNPDDDNNCEVDLQWLQNSSEPWSMVEGKWKKTFNSRTLSLHSTNKDQSIEAYLDQYPALKTPHGYILLTNDFDAAHEEEKNNLFIHFPLTKQKLLDLLKKKKTKDQLSEELVTLCDSSNEEIKNLAAFLSIPHLLKTSTVKQKKKQCKVDPSCSWKPSKVESRDAFITHVKSDADVVQAIELRYNALKDKGASLQPYIIIVGDSLKAIKTYLIVTNKSTIYESVNIINAVDTCYKITWALNAEYSIDSYAIWFFIQRGFYKMMSKFDRGSTSAESLLTDCNM